MKTLKLFFILLLILSAASVYAQAPNLQAENSFGGREADRAFSIQQTKDGGFIFAGHTASNNADVHGNHGDEDMWVVKLNKDGSIKWQKPLGGFEDETGFSIQQTTDGGYIVAGESNSFNGDVTGNHGNLDFWVVKLDSSGNLIWQKSLGGSNADFATSVQQTKDGGYILAGGSFSNDGDLTLHHGPNIYADYWIVKIDAVGTLQWQKTYGGSLGDIAQSVRQTNDGGYIIAGNSASNDGDITGVHDIVYGDAWIIKLNAQGNLQWQKTYGGSDYEQANSIQQTTDGGYIAAGWSRSNDGNVTGNHGNYDVWVTKLGNTGNLQWQKSLGGSNGDLAYSIQQTKDNGYVVAGGTSSNDGDASGNHGKEDFWVVKLNNNGAMQWQKSLGGSEYEEARSIYQTKDGGYAIAGWSGFINVNNGDVTGNHGDYDVWIAKLAASGAIASVNSSVAENTINKTAENGLTISPNPASSFIQVDIAFTNATAMLQVMNSAGQLVMEKSLIKEKGNYHQQLNISALPAGSYYVIIKSGNTRVSRQFVKE